jgi:hypothetical protein
MTAEHMSNVIFQSITVLALLIHIGALSFAILRRTIQPVAWLNLLVAVGVWIYWVPRLGRVIETGDLQAIALLAFALAAAAASLAVLAGRRVPSLLIWLFFTAQAVACILAAMFAFTFKMTRLF